MYTDNTMVHKNKYFAILLFALIGTISLFVANAQQPASSPVVHNSDASIFDYGQRDGSFYQSAGSVFNGTMSMKSNYAYTQPQQTIVHLGYDSTRVEVVNVKCLAAFGCYKSLINNDVTFSGHRPYINVCFDYPLGALPVTELFSITFRAKVDLGERNNWWTSSFGEAPGSCSSNPSGLNFKYNQAGGSGVCDSSFDPCDRGPGPGDLTYEGFGPAEQKGTQSQGSGQSVTTNATTGGGGSSTIATKPVENQTNAVPVSSSQGSNEEIKIAPSPFIDGKEYAPGNLAETARALASNPTKSSAKTAILLGIFVLIAAAACFVITKRFRK